MLIGSRLHLKIESMQQVDGEFVYFEACYVNVEYKSIQQWEIDSKAENSVAPVENKKSDLDE